MKIKSSLSGLPVITALLSTLAASVVSTSAMAAEYNAKLSLDVPEGADAGSECNTVNVSMMEPHGTSPSARSSSQWDT